MNLRKGRFPLLAAVVLLLGAVLTAVLVGSHSTSGSMNPDSASADGGRALATLLRDRGFTISTVHSSADAVAAVQGAGSDVTLMVTAPFLLSQDQLDTLAGQRVGRLVLIEPDYPATAALTSDGRLDESATHSTSLLDPGCADADASAAGNADIGDGTSFSAPAGCYPMAPDRSGYALVMTSGPASPDTVLVGSRTPFRNDKLADDGNAALALRLLGKHPTIVWYLPDTADPAAASDQQTSFWQVIPAGWRWGTLMAAVSALLLAVWQARRLGPVVVENLPVVVRAAETVEGRARLYERGKVQGRAAEALREAARNRLATRLGLPRTASAGDVAAAVAARGGRPSVEVVGLLAGPAPSDDRQLVRLAGALDELEAEVGRL